MNEWSFISLEEISRVAINLDIVGKKSEPVEFEYTWKDCVLYALGIGAQREELGFLFEKGELKVFPTFAAIPALLASISVRGDLGADPVMILHGAQKVILHRSIPPEGKLSTTVEVKAIYDKVKMALVEVETKTTTAEGKPLFDNLITTVCRGEGGFGGDRGPEAKKIMPPKGKAPDFSVSYKTQENQALLYRLSGDFNPLHADPEFAQKAGYDLPILHGLCTFGYAGRAVLHSVCDSDPAKFKSFSARFTEAVFPGDTITTEGWKDAPGGYIIQAKTQNGKVVLGNAYAEVAE